MNSVKNNIPRYVSRAAWGLLVLLFTLMACVKIDVQPQLKVVVKDAEGQLVGDAVVGLFENVEEWSMRENPTQAWKSTNKNGEVLFVDLIEGHYYIYIRKNGLDNSSGVISLDKPLKMNQQYQVIIFIR